MTEAIESRAFETMQREELGTGIIVEYIGDRDDMPKRLVVSTIAKNGYLHFKGTHKYCRPWDVRVLGKAPASYDGEPHPHHPE